MVGTNLAINSAQQQPGAAATGTAIQVGPLLNLTSSFGSFSNQFATQFSPVGELRLNVAYQVTRSIALKVGYTGFAVGNVTRASNRVDYSGYRLISIAHPGDHQALFVNGINFGVEVNR